MQRNVYLAFSNQDIFLRHASPYPLSYHHVPLQARVKDVSRSQSVLHHIHPKLQGLLPMFSFLQQLFVRIFYIPIPLPSFFFSAKMDDPQVLSKSSPSLPLLFILFPAPSKLHLQFSLVNNIIATQPFEGSTTPPPLPGHPPALNRMASLGNAPSFTKGKPFE